MAVHRVCPFCQSDHIALIAREGSKGDMLRFMCKKCDHTWSEQESKAEREAQGDAPR
jgi:transposase-like protein